MELDLRTPFTYADGRDSGLSERALRRTCRKVFPGVWVRADIPDSLVVRSKAALLAAPPGGTISDCTAARLWGAHPPTCPHIHLAYTRDVGTRIRGIQIHRFTTPFETAHRQ